MAIGTATGQRTTNSSGYEGPTTWSGWEEPLNSTKGQEVIRAFCNSIAFNSPAHNAAPLTRLNGLLRGTESSTHSAPAEPDTAEPVVKFILSAYDARGGTSENRPTEKLVRDLLEGIKNKNQQLNWDSVELTEELTRYLSIHLNASCKPPPLGESELSLNVPLATTPDDSLATFSFTRGGGRDNSQFNPDFGPLPDEVPEDAELYRLRTGGRNDLMEEIYRKAVSEEVFRLTIDYLVKDPNTSPATLGFLLKKQVENHEVRDQKVGASREIYKGLTAVGEKISDASKFIDRSDTLSPEEKVALQGICNTEANQFSIAYGARRARVENPPSNTEPGLVLSDGANARQLLDHIRAGMAQIEMVEALVVKTTEGSRLIEALEIKVAGVPKSAQSLFRKCCARAREDWKKAVNSALYDVDVEGNPPLSLQRRFETITDALGVVEENYNHLHSVKKAAERFEETLQDMKKIEDELIAVGLTRSAQELSAQRTKFFNSAEAIYSQVGSVRFAQIEDKLSSLNEATLKVPFDAYEALVKSASEVADARAFCNRHLSPFEGNEFFEPLVGVVNEYSSSLSQQLESLETEVIATHELNPKGYAKLKQDSEYLAKNFLPSTTGTSPFDEVVEQLYEIWRISVAGSTKNPGEPNAPSAAAYTFSLDSMRRFCSSFQSNGEKSLASVPNEPPASPTGFSHPVSPRLIEFIDGFKPFLAEIESTLTNGALDHANKVSSRVPLKVDVLGQSSFCKSPSFEGVYDKLKSAPGPLSELLASEVLYPTLEGSSGLITPEMSDAYKVVLVIFAEAAESVQKLEEAVRQIARQFPDSDPTEALIKIGDELARRANGGSDKSNPILSRETGQEPAYEAFRVLDIPAQEDFQSGTQPSLTALKKQIEVAQRLYNAAEELLRMFTVNPRELMDLITPKVLPGSEPRGALPHNPQAPFTPESLLE
jgi:hypothetical protein